MHRYNQRPIEIGRLQRHAMDHFYGSGMPLAVAPITRRGSVACIGAGPASLACAAQLRQQGFAVTIFDSRSMAGGLNTYGVAEYKLGALDNQKEIELVRSLGVEFRLSAEIGGELRTKEVEDQFDLLFLGVGLGPTQPLGIPGQDLSGVIEALRFIAEYKTKRGATRVGKRVVVIGGGNTAIDAATAALRLGADQVDVLYRRSELEMPAFRFEYDLAKEDGVHFHWLTLPVAVHGKDAVESIECVRMELGPPDRRGRRQPQPVPGSNFHLNCDMVIPSIGQSRLLGFLSQFRGIQLEGGCVVVDGSGQTTNPRYFAAGDCVNGGREVVDAVAEGKRAATGMARRLEQIHG
jgi:glutamate synthase (NADPH/NADH) small chain